MTLACVQRFEWRFLGMVGVEMASWRIRVLFVIVASVVIAPTAVGQLPANAAQLGERIQSDFPPVWKRATDTPYISNCSFEQFRLTGGERRSQAITFRFRRGTEGRFALSMELTAFDEPPGKAFPSYARAINPQYEFHLNKTFGGSGWLLTNWRLTGEAKPDYRSPVTYTPAILNPFQHLVLGGTPLDKVIAHPNWKVTAIQPSPIDVAQVRVTFTFTFTDPTNAKAIHRYAGWFDLDPKAGWCVRRSDYQLHLEMAGTTFEKRFICDHQYRLIDGSVPVLTDVRCDDTDLKPDGSSDNPQQRVFRFDTQYPDAVRDVEFTMTAFGLPEPVGVEPPSKSSPRYVWWLVGAGGCAALALLFRLVGRRRKQADLPVST